MFLPAGSAPADLPIGEPKTGRVDPRPSGTVFSEPVAVLVVEPAIPILPSVEELEPEPLALLAELVFPIP